MFDPQGIDSLETTVRDLMSGDVKRVPDEDLERSILAFQRVIDRLQVERLRLIAEANRRKSFARDGFVSASAWLADKNRTTFAAAKREVTMASALEEMPRTREALERGELSSAAAGMLVKAREAAEAAFESHESSLVAEARSLPLGALRTRVAAWVQKVDPDGAEERAEVRYARRQLSVFPAVDGMVRINGDLDPESGSPVISALGAIVDRDTRGRVDTRTPAQRRADAIAEICSAWLASSGRARVAGERPNLTVVVDIDVLQRRKAGRCEIPDVGPITVETARRIACDASVSRVVVQGPSEPLELGRKTAVVPLGLRRAVAVRDRGCCFPGCDRPPSWCDAHHVRHWADGGETSLSNLVLLCRPHHRMLHNGFSIRMIEGRPSFRRPDGSVIEERSSPSRGSHPYGKAVNSAFTG
jgi:hypothetical protein